MSSLLSKPWLMNFMEQSFEANNTSDNHIATAGSSINPAKQRNLVQITNHSTNCESVKIDTSNPYIVHLSDGFHFVSAVLTPKFVKRFYR